MKVKLRVTCIGCDKEPHEIDEYVSAAEDEEVTPLDYVKSEEGTYNRFITNKFYCTPCYFRAGMPLIQQRGFGH